MGDSVKQRRGERSFLGRLARDVRGNTLAIMAASLIPLAGMIGGGLDLSRMYIVKTRLQHACDAGALAGRKAMGGGTWSQSNNMPNATAETFFKANYAEGSYGSSELTKAFSENAGKVTGTASAKIPLTLTKVLFGAIWSQANSLQTLAVTCATEMRLPNTDVMFVLDTTGSMGDPQPGDTVSKLQALKTAVKCFYEIVARLDTDAACVTGTPGGGTGSQVQIRFGFVPFSTNVNVGYLLKPEWVADSWKYQSRAAEWWVLTKSTVGPDTPFVASTAQADCTYQNGQAAGYIYKNEKITGDGQKRTVDGQDAKNIKWSGGICSAILFKFKREYDRKENIFPTANDEFIDWHYGQIDQNIAGLKNNGTWNSSLTLPINTNGTNKTIPWAGCIEERKTVKATNYSPIPSDSYDLNIDLVPTSDVDTQWGPALDKVIYTRNGAAIGSWTRNESYTTAEYGNGSSFICPTAAKAMQSWPDASAFSTYVDSLVSNGNTYHDIGLAWGARLLSPTGLFAASNAYTPTGGEIQRNLIFMTDGDACTSASNYQAYGLAWFDRRETDINSVPTEGCTTNDKTLTEQVNLKTEALCSAIKNKNITLWVVAFGTLAPTTETRLKTCASDGKYFVATNAATLQSTFKSIADQISQLRLTQ